MKITVTRKMIDRGIRSDSFRCALTLAFNAAGFDVMVTSDHVDFYDARGEVCATLPLPPVAQSFQKRFDAGKPVEPFEFEMPGLEPGVEPFTHFRSVAVAHALFGEPVAV
jgi:hypothetical protein